MLRGVGNASGRGRAGPDGKPRPAKPPRALVISTGEEIPGGQSLRARLLVIEVTKTAIGDGDLRKLRPYQEAASSGQYAMAMAGFIQWLAKDCNDGRRTEFDKDAKARRHEMAASANHARTSDIGAQLAATWRFITSFAVECGAISETDAAAYVARADAALALVTSEQSDIQGTVDPIERFRALLNGVIASGRAHIANIQGEAPVAAAALGWRKEGMDWKPQGRLIGWEDGVGGLYLEPEASFTAVQEMGLSTGEGVGIGSATLRKRLHERGMLLTTEKDRNKVRLTVRATIAGRRRNVLHIQNLLTIHENGAPSAPDAPIDQKSTAKQDVTNNGGAKRSAPLQNESAPVHQTQNGLAHHKCATGKKCASAPSTLVPDIKGEKVEPVHLAHLAHKFSDIGAMAEENGLARKLPPQGTGWEAEL